mgnify:CR=1 FL=1
MVKTKQGRSSGEPDLPCLISILAVSNPTYGVTYCQFCTSQDMLPQVLTV